MDLGQWPSVWKFACCCRDHSILVVRSSPPRRSTEKRKINTTLVMKNENTHSYFTAPIPCCYSFWSGFHLLWVISTTVRNWKLAFRFESLAEWMLLRYAVCSMVLMHYALGPASLRWCFEKIKNNNCDCRFVFIYSNTKMSKW